MGDVYALDFDGVLCDSCGESSISAVKAAKVRWPDLFTSVDASLEDWIVDQMHVVRPVVETGYENLLLVRLLLEIQLPSLRTSSVSAGLTVEGILENWTKLKPVIMSEWNENKDSLVDLFGKVRDEWMETDFTKWIGANRFYPGVSDALKFASSRVYIVTTKQSRFADALLRELAGVTIPAERIYGLGSGPKVEVLKQLQRKQELQGLTLHFVEDRIASLKNVKSRVADEEEYEKMVLVTNTNRDDSLIEAHSVEEAISKMSVAESILPADRHPERRLKASFKAFEEAELPKLKEEKPGLTHTQYKDMIWKLWKKSPDNPLNQVAE